MTFSYLSVKRADYQQILHEAAIEAGCDLRLGQKVSGIDEDLPGVEIQGGGVVRGDLVVVGDGKIQSLKCCPAAQTYRDRY